MWFTLHRHRIYQIGVSMKYVCHCRPEGYLYDKEAILEYYIHQKNDYKRKLKEYEKQKKKMQVRFCYLFTLHTAYCFVLWITLPAHFDFGIQKNTLANVHRSIRNNCSMCYTCPCKLHIIQSFNLNIPLNDCTCYRQK